MHISISNLNISGSDNGLSPSRCQAIIRTNAEILLIEPLGTSFSEIFIRIHAFSYKKMHLNMSTGIWWPFCLVPNALKHCGGEIWFLTTLMMLMEHNGRANIVPAHEGGLWNNTRSGTLFEAQILHDVVRPQYSQYWWEILRERSRLSTWVYINGILLDKKFL